MSKGKAFEKFIDNLERLLNESSGTTVERNAYLQTKNGSRRQIDVLLTHRTDRHTFTTIIECKDWKRKVDVKVIEEFASKIKAVDGDKGIIISKSGFTSGLIKESEAYSNISLYTIEQIDQVTNEILDFNSVGYYKITHSSNDWTVRFHEKLDTNQAMKLYTKLKFNDNSTSFDITEIAQEFLSQNRDFLVKKILDTNKTAKAAIEAEITLDINLATPAFYEIDGIKTYVIGFKSVIKSMLNITAIEITEIYKYKNLSKNETVALLLKLDLDEETMKLVLS
jgi:Restriction endonuclease